MNKIPPASIAGLRHGGMANLLDAIRAIPLPSDDRKVWQQVYAGDDFGRTYRIEHDGFVGEVIGHYRTREGKEGVVLQQAGTRVVHVYGRRWLKEAGDE